MTPRVITIADGVAEAQIVPGLGAGLASYDLLAAAERTALFRPCRDLSRAGPFDLANNLLVPWSNRISGGGFHFGGAFHRLDPNLPEEPYPIHGNGFSSRWSIERSASDSAELSLRSEGPGPFRYEAHAAYAWRTARSACAFPSATSAQDRFRSASASTRGSSVLLKRGSRPRPRA